MFGDLDNSGILDGSESGISGVTVQLKSGSTVAVTSTTDASGYYRFDNLSAGTYTVFLPASNFTSGGPLAGKVSSTSVQSGDKGNKGIYDANPATYGVGTASATVGYNSQLSESDTGSGAGAHSPNEDAYDDLTIDFGMVAVQENTYSIGNRLYRDPDNDGQPDLDNLEEGGIANVTLKVFAADENGNPTAPALATTTTDADGFYRFDGLAEGAYVVVVDKAGASILSGYVSATGVSTDTSASGDIYDKGKDTPLGDSSVLPGGIASVQVTLGSGFQPVGEATAAGAGANGPNGDASDNLTMDFAFAPLLSIGNRVFADANNNGILDGVESGISGVKVKLFVADGSGNPTGSALASTNTDSSGYYRFDSLQSGTYVVVVDVASSPLTGNRSCGGARTDNLAAGDKHQHGKDTPVSVDDVVNGIASGSVRVGKWNVTPLTGETDYLAPSDTSAGAHSPNGDAADYLIMDFGFTRAAYKITATTTTPVPGAGNTLTITLVDQAGNVITSFTGDIDLTFSGLSVARDGTYPTVTGKDGAPVAQGTPTTLTFVNGVAQAVLVAYRDQSNVLLGATDGNSCSTTSPGGSSVSLTISQASPVAFDQDLTRAPSASLQVLQSALMAGATDPNHDIVSFSSVQGATIESTVFASGDYVYYLPGSTVDGATFTYTVSDGQENTATKTVTIHVVTPGGLAKSIEVTGGTVTITFFGIPGFTYALQRSTTVDGTYTTVEAAGTNTAAANGKFTFTDTVSNGSYFYRSIQQ